MAESLFIMKFCTIPDGIGIFTTDPPVALLYFDQQLARDRFEESHKHQNEMMQSMFDIKDFAKTRANDLFPDDELFDKEFEKIVRICAKNDFRKKEIKATLVCKDIIMRIID
ncbi:hypothetical protein [uncultured Microscilla sp.]|uniref:hypothetical protein n=1 Tax=uncultured Microscilla sp. TaxID=432653 RepID=UPI002612729D|nr:hypothetical protein [uncultured Microscilla sp.]